MDPKSYLPNRRSGMAIHWALILVFLAMISLCIWQASIKGGGTGLILWSFGALVSSVPIPFLVYRLYALIRGNYILDRESFTMRWGLRIEQIPISDIEWIRSVQDLSHPLDLPRFSTPGAITGMQKHPDLGSVEFLASDRKSLLLVATARQVYAISPKDPITFVQDFQRTIEIGSLTPVPTQSIYPSFVVGQAWNSKLTRILWIIGVLLNAGLLVWVSILVPRFPSIPLGFITTGVPRSFVPSVQLFLLPVISSFFFVVNWLAGIYFSRRPKLQTLANIVWGFSILSAALFLIAVGFIITTA